MVTGKMRMISIDPILGVFNDLEKEPLELEAILELG